MRVELAGLELNNPVMTASGTFGFGREYSQFFDLDILGALVVKGLTLHSRQGNPPPRIVETAAGTLNSVGLQNPGLQGFLTHELPFIRQYELPVIANISGKKEEEYSQLARGLGEKVDALEVNISCPNVRQGGMAFGTDPEQVRRVISGVCENTDLPVIAKLSPNVTDIQLIACSAVEAGADIISLINTLTGMAIDLETRRPILPGVVGGLSGPAIKPVALHLVHQVAQAVEVPVIGMGGIMKAEDALEFLLAGASAVAVGTASLVNPMAAVDIIRGIESYLQKEELKVDDLIGGLKL